MRTILICLMLALVCWNCVEKKENPEHRVFVVNLVDDTAKIQQYLDYHKNIWPEVEAGFRAAGYYDISLYRFSNLLVMTLDVPYGADLDSMGNLAERTNAKCAEWNRVMNTYQQGVSGTSPGQTWVEAKRFYHFKLSNQ